MSCFNSRLWSSGKKKAFVVEFFQVGSFNDFRLKYPIMDYIMLGPAMNNEWSGLVRRDVIVLVHVNVCNIMSKSRGE